jgi:mRNA interferase MazF
MNRGDLAVAVLPGNYGKPRPVLIVQSDLFLAKSDSVTVLPLTTEILDAPVLRIHLEPSAKNGLKAPSQVMVDKIHTLRRDKIGYLIGRIGQDDLLLVNRALAQFLGFS